MQLLGSFDEAGIPVLPNWLYNMRDSVETVARDTGPTAVTWGISIFESLRSVVERALHLACLTMSPYHSTHSHVQHGRICIIRSIAWAPLDHHAFSL